MGETYIRVTADTCWTVSSVMPLILLSCDITLGEILLGSSLMDGDLSPGQDVQATQPGGAQALQQATSLKTQADYPGALPGCPSWGRVSYAMVCASDCPGTSSWL